MFNFMSATNTITASSSSSGSVTTTSHEKQQMPSWVEEFLDTSSPWRGRGSHRSSASDSITFLEECQSSDHGVATEGTTALGLDVLDEDQLICMFSDYIALPPPSPSNQNINNNEKPMTLHAVVPMQEHDIQKPKIEACRNNAAATTEPPSAAPRRVKRILANRQSAQRSRVKKLQYISELERSVTSLQTEVSALSPRVAFLDHQRLILNVDNSALKQRIAALAQDKIFKDAHQEALKKEKERLWQIYHHQNLHKMENSVNKSGHSPRSTPPSQPQPPYSTSAANSISALGM